jgi:hypothetical protein
VDEDLEEVIFIEMLNLLMKQDVTTRWRDKLRCLASRFYLGATLVLVIRINCCNYIAFNL